MGPSSLLVEKSCPIGGQQGYPGFLGVWSDLSEEAEEEEGSFAKFRSWGVVFVQKLRVLEFL